MRIARLEIESYRSIGFCELVFQKRKPDLWLIVGENNSGKTTILKAMEILLNKRNAIKTNHLHDYNNSDAWQGKNQTLRLAADVQIRDNRTIVLEREWRLEAGRLEQKKRTVAKDFDGGFIMIEPKEEAYGYHLTKSGDPEERKIIHLLERQLQASGSFRDGLKALEDHLRHSLFSVSAVRNIRIEPESLLISVDDGTLAPITDKAPGLQKFVILSILEWLNRQQNSVLQSYVLGFDEPESHLHPQSVKNIARRIRQLADDGLQIFCTSHSPYFVYQAGAGGTVRVVNRYQSAAFFGLPVSRMCKDNERYDYARKIPISENIRKVFPDRLIRNFLRRPLLQSEKTLNSLFSNFAFLVEGESEEIYIPLLYTIWRRQYFDDWLAENRDRIGMDPAEVRDRVPFFLDEMDIHLVPLQGKFALNEFLILFTLFNIDYHVLLDNDGCEESNRNYNKVIAYQKAANGFIFDGKEAHIALSVQSPSDLFEKAKKMKVANPQERELTIYTPRKKFETEDFVILLIGWDRFKAVLKKYLFEKNKDNWKHVSEFLAFLDRYDWERGNFNGINDKITKTKVKLTKIDIALAVSNHIIDKNYNVVDPRLKLNPFKETGLEKALGEIALNHLRRYRLSENPRISGAAN